MNILFLDQFSEMGGAQRGVLDILEAVAERGWRASVLIPAGGPLVEYLGSRKIAVGEIPCGPYRSGRKSIADVVRFLPDVGRQRRVIRQRMERDKFDLLYVNGPRVMPAASMAARARAPVLFHAHSHIRPGSAARLIRWSVGWADAAVVACSKSVASSIGSGAEHVIPNGTRDIGFRERSFDGWRIGMIGRISPEKGQTEFLRAVELLAPDFPGVRFSICGARAQSAKKYYDAVSAAARRLDVQLLEWREDVACVFGGLDLLAVPSKEEGMPRVVVEAFSAGVPVVAFPAGGIPEVVAHGETGFLVPERSGEALAARLRDIMTGDAASLRRIAAKARQEWERWYTLGAFQKSITDLMERQVSDWRAAHGIEAPPRRK